MQLAATLTLTALALLWQAQATPPAAPEPTTVPTVTAPADPRPVDLPVDVPADVPADTVPFDRWLADLIAETRTRGFDEALITQALSGLEPLAPVVASDRSQPEITITLDRYLAPRLARPVVRRGRALAREHRGLLTRIETTAGVPGRYLLAIWGLESRFGRSIGRTPVFQALATLAWEPRRADFFRGQLFDALTMVQRGYIDAASMTGSWAGAMGQTQFMPSSYLRYAVDFDGDGRRDIWRSTPDALASIGTYLKGYGWQRGVGWGRPVTVSDSVREAALAAVPLRTEGCFAVRMLTEPRPMREWRRLGIRPVGAGQLPASATPVSYVRTGGRDFLVTANYEAILGYNCAHFYALSVSMLADRLR